MFQIQTITNANQNKCSNPPPQLKNIQAAQKKSEKELETLKATHARLEKELKTAKKKTGQKSKVRESY
jgi:peptidoglycan hydrolase CwlO-like protein